jgi:hypothetical protein
LNDEPARTSPSLFVQLGTGADNFFVVYGAWLELSDKLGLKRFLALPLLIWGIRTLGGE